SIVTTCWSVEYASTQDHAAHPQSHRGSSPSWGHHSDLKAVYNLPSVLPSESGCPPSTPTRPAPGPKPPFPTSEYRRRSNGGRVKPSSVSAVASAPLVAGA